MLQRAQVRRDAPAAATAPAATIRDYLEELDEGVVEVPFHNLLTTFEFDDPGALERQQMVAELAHAGVHVNRSLGELRPDDPVGLRLVREPSRAPWDGAPPAVPPPSDTPTTQRRWPTRVGLGLLVLALIGGAGAGAFFLGRDTRLSDTQVEAKLTSQASHDKRLYTRQAQAALAKQKTTLNKRFEQRQQTAVNQASAAGEQRGQAAGFSSGQEQGFNSGKAKGYDQGHGEGAAEGYGQGFDEGTCYTPDDFEYVC